MRIAITGIPGTGKTSVAKALAKKLKCKLVNDKEFALKNKIGTKGKKGELEVPLEKFSKAVKKI